MIKFSQYVYLLSYVWLSGRYEECHVDAQLVIPGVAPAAVTFAQLVFLGAGGEGQGQVRGVEMPCRVSQHFLHLGDNTGALAVGLLVVNPTEIKYTLLLE